MPDFMDLLPNPDEVGESLYRTVLEELSDWFTSMPDQNQGEIALDFARDLRQIASTIENTVKANDKE